MSSMLKPRIFCKVIVTTLFLVALSLPCSAKEIIRTIEGTVTKVSDGDTIHVTDRLGTKVKVRFYGIDCPETEKSNKRTGHISKAGQPYGEESYQALRRKLPCQVDSFKVEFLV